MHKTKSGRQALSWMLVLVLILSLLPASVLAAEGETAENRVSMTYEDTLDAAVQTDSLSGSVLNEDASAESTTPAETEREDQEEAVPSMQADDTLLPAESNTSDAYVLMNIPYAEFYKTVGATNEGIDAISSATNKVGNYGKSGGAFHSGTSAQIGEDGSVTAVGGANNAKNEGVTWPVKVSAGVDLSTLNGTKIEASATKTIATIGRGQSSASYLYGYECLTEAPAYSYYELSATPSYYIELTSVTDGKAAFGANSGTAETKTGATVTASYGTNWGDVQLSISGAEEVADKLVNAMVITASDGSRTTVKAGLVHLYNIWSATDIAWKTATVPGLDGKSITNIRYYCTVKDDSVEEGNSEAPAYANFVYDYSVNAAISPVYTGTVTAAFNGADEIVLTGLPADIQNAKAKVYHNAGGRPAVLTYLTPLEVDPADQDIDPVNADIQNGKIAISATLQTVTNSNGESKTYGQPVDGTEYTVEISSDNWVIRSVKATYTASGSESDSGGSSGSGGNSSTNVTVPVSGNQNSIKVAVQISGSTATISKIDTRQIEKVIGDNVRTGMVEIDFSDLDKAIDAVNLPSDSIGKIAEAAKDPGNDVQGLTVKLSTGEISFDSSALNAVTSQAGSQITLSAARVRSSDLNSRQREVVGNAPVFDLILKSGSKVITDFQGGIVTVVLNYELQPGQDPAGIVIYHLDNSGNVQACETIYDVRNNTVMFTTGYLSLYFVGYDNTTVWTNPFTDVSDGAYYYDAVRWAVESAVTAGTTKTTFSPDSGCTRAQAVTFIWRANGSPESTASNPFTDVKEGDYCYHAVMWAVEKGITEGTSATTFSPDAACTRGQIVSFLYRAAGSPDANGEDPFNDVASDDYFCNAVCWAVEKGITAGTSGTSFSPNARCTRGQIVTFLYRNRA